jgi:hypothetical protein
MLKGAFVAVVITCLLAGGGIVALVFFILRWCYVL